MKPLMIRKLQNEDIKIVYTWLMKPYVKQWFEDSEDWMQEIEERNTTFSWIHHFIVLWGEKPIGFCQYYKCIDAMEDWYGDTDLLGTYSIDYMIGEEDYLGKGIGKALIVLLTNRVFSLPECKRIIVHVDKENDRSRNTLLRSGYNHNEVYDFYIKIKV